MISIVPSVLLVILFTLIAGFYSAGGVALVSARRTRLRDMADLGNKRARCLLRVLEDPGQITATTEMAVRTLWLATAAVTYLGFTPPFCSALVSYGVQWPLPFALFILTVLLSAYLLIFIDLVPRSLGAHMAESLAIVVYGPLDVTAKVLSPFVNIVTAIANGVVKPIGGKCRLGVPVRSEEELKLLVEAVEDEGVIEEGEREMIDSIFEFNDTLVRQVITPRIDMHAMSVESSVDEVLDEIIESGHSRIPVYDTTVDSVIGVVHAKDLLAAARRSNGGTVTVRDVMRAAFFVPENKKVSDLLGEFRKTKQQLAIVRDEYGGTAGLVTVEDLIEEIVGEIQDEYDQEEPQVTIQEGDTYLVEARTSISDLNEELDLNLSDDEFETIGGFVFGLLGKEPEVGDTARYNGYLFTVTEKDDRRVRKIQINTAPDDDQPPNNTANSQSAPQSE